MAKIRLDPFLIVWTPTALLALVATGRSAARMLQGYTGHRSSILPPAVERWFVVGLDVAAAVFLLAAAAVLVRARVRNASGALLSLAFPLLCATNLQAANFWFDLGLVGAWTIIDSLGWGLLLMACLTFPDGSFRLGWAKPAAIAGCIVFAWIGFDLLSQIEGTGSGGAGTGGAQPAVSPLRIYTPELVKYAAIGVGALALLRRLPQAANQVERQQIRCALFGIAAFVFLLAAWAVINMLATLFPSPWSAGVMRFGARLIPIGYLCLAGGFLVALLRYRLYDAQRLMSTSAAYAMLTAAASALFVVGEAVMKSLVAMTGARDANHSVVTAILAIALVAPLKKGVSNWMEARFRRPLQQLRSELPASLVELRTISSEGELLAEALGQIHGALRPVRSAVVLGDRFAVGRRTDEAEVSAWLQSNPLVPSAPGTAIDREDPIFPVRIELRIATEAELLGWLLVGPRLDGSLYPRDEQAALSNVAAPIARGVRAIRLRERRNPDLPRASGELAAER